MTTARCCHTARRARGRGGCRFGKVVAGLVAAAVALLAWAPPAAAHAELESTQPAADERLDAPPPEVVLRFTEAVQIDDDAIQVYAASGDLVDTSEPAHPAGDGAAVAARLPDLSDGAYVVAWRVVSADGHPISGAFTFLVGDAAAGDADALMADLLAGSGGDRPLGIAYGAARFAAFAGIVVLVGGVAFLLALWPAGLADRRARRLVAAAGAVTAVATIACIGLHGAEVQGLALTDALDPAVVRDELGTRTGRMWALRLAVLAVAAVVVGVRSRGWAGRAESRPVEPAAAVSAAVAGLVLLVTISATGHAVSGDLVGLAVVLDVVHLAGACVWLGGLAVLAVAALRPAVAAGPGLGDAVRRFSTVAFGCVVVIAASGTVQGWRQLRSIDALFTTSYGRLLLAKVALVAAMVAAAAVSRAWVRRWLLAPAGAAGGGPAPAPGPGGGHGNARGEVRTLRRSVAAESLIAIAVLAVTAALVDAVPGRSATEPGPFTAELHGTNVLVEVTVEPAAVGPVGVEVQVAFHDGTPLEPEELSATLALPARSLGPLDVALEPTGDPGRYVSRGAQLPFPGEWEIEVVARTTDIDQDRLSALFTVRQ